MMSAPWSAAQVDSVGYLEGCLPAAFQNLDRHDSCAGAIPAGPMPLLVHCATVPITWVPWPLSSSVAARSVDPVKVLYG